MKASVIVPTYRRPDLVLRCLSSLQKQTFSDFEILIVDNACQQEVEKSITAFQPVLGSRLKYLPEPALGVHNARHTGARNACTGLLLFTDDDASLAPGWVEAYVRAFEEHPEMVVAGGPVQPEWESPPPEWILEFIGDGRMVPVLAMMKPYTGFQLRKDGFFYSVNMAIRKNVFFEMGGFHPEAFGKIWLGDGESGLNYKFWNQGVPVGYVPEAEALHYVPRGRMTIEFFLHWSRNNGAADAYTRFHAGIPPRSQLLLLLLKSVVMNRLRSVLIHLRNRGRLDRASIERQMWHAHERGVEDYIVRVLQDSEFRSFVLRKDWLN